MKKDTLLYAIVCKKSLKDIDLHGLTMNLAAGTVVDLPLYEDKTPPKGTLFIDNKLHKSAKYPHLAKILIDHYGLKKSATEFRLDKILLPKSDVKEKKKKKKKIKESE